MASLKNIFNNLKSINSIKDKTQKKSQAGRGLILIILLLVLIAAAVFFGFRAYQGISMDPKELLNEALSNTFSANTYNFKSKSVLNMAGEERIFSVLEGEKAGNNRHIQGSILGTDVNIYNIDDTIYQQDPVGGTWNVVKNKDLAALALLITETDPEENYRFKDIGEVIYLGKEKVEEANTRKIEFYPVLEDEWIERYFKDITFTLWVSNGSRPYIVKAVISGVSKENSEAKLVIENYFSDLNKEITIQTPFVGNENINNENADNSSNNSTNNDNTAQMD